ncbi:hypothetical protein JTB14_015153 [Gonioctena quinquepunctata]|nr:hypothetical protein JTB14_015153 [Gonioctena quinquepunctata]
MLNLNITINEPTVVTPTTSSTIDNILINTNLDYHSETTNLGIYDQTAQILSLKLDNQVSKEHNIIYNETQRIFNGKNSHKFSNVLNEINWVPLYVTDDINDVFIVN